MNAVIPTGEATDSDFGAFAEISLAAANKVRAEAHYTALAEEAAAMFKPCDYRSPWELRAVEHNSADRRTAVAADKSGTIRLSMAGSRMSLCQHYTPAEARALASELVKAADALAGRAG